VILHCVYLKDDNFGTASHIERHNLDETHLLFSKPLLHMGYVNCLEILKLNRKNMPKKKENANEM
jgi:hypothetical protein